MWLRGRRVTVSAATQPTSMEDLPRLRSIIPVLGVTQILAWGSSYYLLAVLAKPIADDTGWPLAWVVGGLSLGLLMAGLVSPRVGDSIQRLGGRLVLATSAAFLAFGLIGLALSPNLPVYVLWGRLRKGAKSYAKQEPAEQRVEAKSAQQKGLSARSRSATIGSPVQRPRSVGQLHLSAELHPSTSLSGNKSLSSQ